LVKWVRYGRKEKACRILLGKPEEKALEDLGIGGRMLLKGTRGLGWD
jgi:hypothetical protein